jgi:hypothetical protein
MHGESLGLTANGMLRNKWIVGSGGLDAAGDDAAPVAGITSIADRLRVARG